MCAVCQSLGVLRHFLNTYCGDNEACLLQFMHMLTEYLHQWVKAGRGDRAEGGITGELGGGVRVCAHVCARTHRV